MDPDEIPTAMVEGPERTGGWTHWFFGSRADCETELDSLGARAIGGKLVRRLLIKTPPEDVP